MCLVLHVLCTMLHEPHTHMWTHMWLKIVLFLQKDCFISMCHPLCRTRAFSFTLLLAHERPTFVSLFLILDINLSGHVADL